MISSAEWDRFLGAVLGAVFVVLFPYAIEAAMNVSTFGEQLSSYVFAVNYAAFGLVMILFLVFEPQGLVGIWRRAQDWVVVVAVQAEAAGQMSALLRVEKLEVTYHRVITAVQGVSLEIAEGSIVCLIGNNGAGKTTTLRAISGFLGLDDARGTDGHVEWCGERIENQPPHRVARRGIALVPERSKVFESLSVEENLDAAVSDRGAIDKARVFEHFRFCASCVRARPATCRAANARCSRSARR